MPNPTDQCVVSSSSGNIEAFALLDLSSVSHCLRLSDILKNIKRQNTNQNKNDPGVDNPFDDIHVPQIITVGDQSHGKTRLVEGISGVQLPQGDGTVTRMPLHLRIFSTPDRVQGMLRARFYRANGRQGPWTKTSRGDLCQLVESLTERHAGSGLLLDGSHIEVEVYQYNLVQHPFTTDVKEPCNSLSHDEIDTSPPPRSLLVLTVTDLPGMTRVASREQEEDIEEQVTSLYLKYIHDPSSLLLNVISANVDFSTSTALKLSRKYDPLGDRTYVVVTKCDLDPQGTPHRVIKACEQLQLTPAGIFFTMNRVKAFPDITLKGRWDIENKFFDRYPAFSKVKGSYIGCQSLTTILSRHHANIIRNQIGKIKLKLESVQNEVVEDLIRLRNELGLSEDTTQENLRYRLAHWGDIWIKSVDASLRGQGVDVRDDIQTISALRVDIDEAFQKLASIDCKKASIQEFESSSMTQWMPSAFPDFEAVRNRIQIKLHNTRGTPGTPGARDLNSVFASECRHIIDTFQNAFVNSYVRVHHDALLDALSAQLDRNADGSARRVKWKELEEYVLDKLIKPVIQKLVSRAYEHIQILGICESRGIICTPEEFHSHYPPLSNKKELSSDSIFTTPEAWDTFIESKLHHAPSEIIAILSNSLFPSTYPSFQSDHPILVELNITLTALPRLDRMKFILILLSDIQAGNVIINQEREDNEYLQWSRFNAFSTLRDVSSKEIEEAFQNPNPRMALGLAVRNIESSNDQSIDRGASSIEDLSHQVASYWVIFAKRFINTAAVLVNGLIYQQLCSELRGAWMSMVMDHPDNAIEWFKPPQEQLDELTYLQGRQKTITEALNSLKGVQEENASSDLMENPTSHHPVSRDYESWNEITIRQKNKPMSPFHSRIKHGADRFRNVIRNLSPH